MKICLTPTGSGELIGNGVTNGGMSEFQANLCGICTLMSRCSSIVVSSSSTGGTSNMVCGYTYESDFDKKGAEYAYSATYEFSFDV